MELTMDRGIAHMCDLLVCAPPGLMRGEAIREVLYLVAGITNSSHLQKPLYILPPTPLFRAIHV